MRSSGRGPVVGIDIIRSGGSDVSKYEYAIAIVENGTLKKVEEGGLGRLIRILWEVRPSILATDNVLEIGGSRRNLLRVAKLIPPDTEIVQVTLGPDYFISIKSLAHKEGISIERGKLEPLKTAVAVATLAERGYGEKITLFERKVRITVYKSRSGYAGGSRSDKFQRSMRAAVAGAVKRIKEILEREGIDYDLTIRKSRGGIERARFTVYADRKELRGIVKEVRSRDVEIRMEPVVSKKLLKLEGGKLRRRYLIVGYDPGIESGLAVVDLDMNPVLITSGKELDRGYAISTLTSLGLPVVIATDKNPPPEVVKKLAAALNAQLFVPQHSLSTSEKELMVKDFAGRFRIDVRNTHERDALAAALKAYKTFETKMEKLSERVRSMGLRVSNIQKYKVRVIRNEPLSKIIEDVISDLVREATSRRDLKERDTLASHIMMFAGNIAKRDTESSRRVKELEERVKELVIENRSLRSRINELESEILELKSELSVASLDISRDILRDRKVGELIQRVRNLTQYVRKLELENENLRKAVGSFSQLISSLFKGELAILRKARIKNGVLRVSKDILGDLRSSETIYLDISSEDDVSIDELAKLTNEVGVKYVVPRHFESLAKKLVSRFVPAITVDNPVLFDDVAVVSVKTLELLEILDRELASLRKAKELEKNSLTEDALEKLINEYRTQRYRSEELQEN